MGIVLLVGIGITWIVLCAVVIGMCWSAKEGDEPAGDLRAFGGDTASAPVTSVVAVSPLASH